MCSLYPQKVDHVKPTNGGLSTNGCSAMQPGMENQVADHVEIGARLKRVREAFSDLSQKDWARKHGFSTTQYNNWETGARRIPVDEAERLCDFYGLTLDFIYRGRRDGLAETSAKVL